MPSFGAATNLIGGTITLTLPAAALYVYIQNQDIAPLLITFPANSGLGPIVLNPCAIASATTGWAGDWFDTIDYPIFVGSVVLTSTVTTAQFGSGYSTSLPVSGISRATVG